MSLDVISYFPNVLWEHGRIYARSYKLELTTKAQHEKVITLIRGNKTSKMASKMRGPGAGCGDYACKSKKARGTYDLADSPSLRVIKKLCNRGLVSSQYLKSFKEKLGAIKAVINSKAAHAADDEEYWLGK